MALQTDKSIALFAAKALRLLSREELGMKDVFSIDGLNLIFMIYKVNAFEVQVELLKICINALYHKSNDRSILVSSSWWPLILNRILEEKDFEASFLFARLLFFSSLDKKSFNDLTNDSFISSLTTVNYHFTFLDFA